MSFDKCVNLETNPQMQVKQIPSPPQFLNAPFQSGAPQREQLFYWCELVLTVLEPLANGLRQYSLLPVWFLLLNIMFKKYIHVVVLEVHPFLFLLLSRTISACQDLFSLSFVEVDLMIPKFFDTLAIGSKPCA